jgi:predicted porin
MKAKILVASIAAMAASGAFAQSSVTVYGVIDAAVTNVSNVGTAFGKGNQSSVGFTEGAFQGSRFGFKGSEDLGGGNAAIFDLEGGFYSYNGASDQQGQLFGRQAWVGLSSKSAGDIMFGRQYGILFKILGFTGIDPLQVGNQGENEWEIGLTGVRFDNSIDYDSQNAFGPINVRLQYSVGGQPGNQSIGNTTGGSIVYASGPLTLGAAVQDSTDQNNKKLNSEFVGGTFVAGPATVILSYLDSKFDAGFAKAASLSGLPLADTSLISNPGTGQRQDELWTAGLNWTLTPAVTFILGYMNDNVRNVLTTGTSGKVSSLYGYVDYNLSKRTDVYLGLTSSKLSGVELLDSHSPIEAFGDGTWGSGDTRTTTSLGLRTHF